MNGWERHNYMNTVLHKYLDRAEKNRPIERGLSSGDADIVIDLRLVRTKMRALMAECIAMKTILERVSPDLKQIAGNMEVMCWSLNKQKELLGATILALKSTEPDQKERESIAYLVVSVKNRINWVRKIINENITLTPVKEYLEIVGSSSLFQDLHSYFPDYKMFQNAESIAEYAEHILSVVQVNGKDNEYAARLDTYLAARNHREDRVKKEKTQQKEKAINDEHDVAERFLFAFSNRLHYCINSETEDPKIGYFLRSAQGKIIKLHGMAIVLRVAFIKGQPRYTYLSGDGQWTSHFASAKIMDKEEAEKSANAWYERHRKCATLVFEC